MTKYLDFSGLSHFWDRLKEYFIHKIKVNKGSTSVDLSGGDIEISTTAASPLALDVEDQKIILDLKTEGSTSVRGIWTSVDGESYTANTIEEYDSVEIQQAKQQNKRDSLPTVSLVEEIVSNVSATATGAIPKITGGTAGTLVQLKADGTLEKTDSKISDFKTKQSAKSSPTASNSALAFIDTISQNANGEITATKKNITLASATQDGLLSVDKSDYTAFNTLFTGTTTKKINTDLLPSYVDDVIMVNANSNTATAKSLAQNIFSYYTGEDKSGTKGTTVTPEEGKIYVYVGDTDFEITDNDGNKTTYASNSQFRWVNGSTTGKELETGMYVKLNDGGVSRITEAEIDSDDILGYSKW